MTSVKQKIAGIEKERGEVQSSVKRMRGAIREQERANAAAACHIDEGAKKLQGAIREQGKINKAAAQEISAGVKKLQGNIKEQERVNNTAVHQIGIGIRKVEDGMAKKLVETKYYIRDFYFGEGKTEGKK